MKLSKKSISAYCGANERKGGENRTDQNIQSYVSNLNREYRKRIKWYRLIAVLSCLTIFLTTYFLILPAITKTDDNSGDFESSDLSRFTTDVSIHDIDGNEIDLENGTVYVGETYIFEIAFSELNDIGNNHQFKYDESYSPPALTYQFSAANMNLSSQVNTPITILTDGVEYTVGHFDIDETGLAKVHFDNVTNTGAPTPGGENFIDLYPEVSFNMKFSVKVDGSSGDKPISINLGNNVVVELIDSPDGDLGIDKKMVQYDESTHTLKYKVVLECTRGTVSDLTCTDTERIRDNQTQIFRNVPLSSYRDIVVRDLNGNYVGSDFTSLPGTLTRGEGYEITYTIPLDQDWYDSRARVNATSINTFTVDGTNAADEPITKSETAYNHFDILNFSKYAYQYGSADDKKVIHWAIMVGDGENPLPNDIIVTDIVNQEQQFYTDLPAQWKILGPDKTVLSSGNFTYGDDFVISGQHATINLPTGGCKYQVDYYTVCQGGKTYTNDAVINYNGWSVEGSITVIDGSYILTKEIANVDQDYIEYHFTVTVPKERYNTDFWIRDRMNDGKSNTSNPNIIIDPIDLVITATDVEANTTVTLNPYDPSASSDISYYIKPSAASNCDIVINILSGTLPAQINNGTRWPFNVDTRIDVTYKVKRDSTFNTVGDSINESLESGSAVTNTVAATGWQNTVSVPYVELPGVAKKGTPISGKDATFEYKVAFTNNKANPVSTNYWDKLALLPESFDNMYLHDMFDERLNFVNGSMFALLYERTDKQVHDLTTTFGESAAVMQYYKAIFEYTGPDITGNTINAKWTDFTESHSTEYGEVSTKNAPNKIEYRSNGDIAISKDWGSHWTIVHNLEEVMQFAPDQYGVVFVYKTQLDDEYRKLSAAQITMEFDNTAYVDFETPDGSIETNKDSATVTYDTKLLDKTFQQVSGMDIARYTIILNEYGVDLTTMETIVIEDTMSSSLQLYLETLKIYVGHYDAGGNLIWELYTGNPKVAIDDISNTLAMTLPDNCPVKITYDCKVKGEQGEQVSLENSVNISGREAEVKTNDVVFEMSGSSSSGSAVDYYMYILKKDIKTNMYLNDASFDLYGNNPVRSTDPTKTVVANGETLYYYTTFTTADNADSPVLNGTFQIDHTWLENKGHFAVIETVPPPGYELSAQLLDFYWQARPAGGIETVPVYENRMTYTYNDYPITPELPSTGSYEGLLFDIAAIVCFSATAVCIGYLSSQQLMRLKCRLCDRTAANGRGEEKRKYTKKN